MEGDGEPILDDRDGASHPKILQNENPALLTSLFSNGTLFFQQYGWFIVVCVALLLYLKHRFGSQVYKVTEKVAKMKKNDSYDPDQIRQRQEAMDAARRKLQEQFDAQASKHQEETSKREEEKRKQKIQDWDNHLQGKGYRSKYRPSSDSPSSSKPKPKPKESGETDSAPGGSKPPGTSGRNVYRNQDYSPLGGAGSSAGYRPARRGGGGVRGGG